MGEWISVEDRLPQAGQVVKYKAEIWRFGSMDRIDSFSGVFDGEYFGDADYDDHYENVTHWQPLPEPPK